MTKTELEKKVLKLEKQLERTKATIISNNKEADRLIQDKIDMKSEYEALKKERLIDKVTVPNLDFVLTACKINLSDELLDNIIDLVELLEDKGDYVSFNDICKLQSEWKECTGQTCK